jgi:hypothetical protein
MTFWSVTLIVIIFVWDLLRDWLFIFISPIKKLEIFWIIIPIWLSWFFSEFFQEKKGTSFGNAISNGVVPLFIGIDWARYITNSLVVGTTKLTALVFIKYFLCLVVIVYGISIIILGIRAKKIVRFYGRVRETTYVLLVFSPIIYGIIDLSWKFLFSIIIFFPLFYYLIELIDKFLPDPKIYDYDEIKEKDSFSLDMPSKKSNIDDKNLKW